MTESKSWKRKLHDAKAFICDCRGSLFDAVGLAMEIVDDRDFLADVGLLDESEAADWIDQELFRDCALTFLELRKVRDRFPAKLEWETETLRDLYEESSKALAELPETPTRQVTRITKKQYEEMESQRDEYKARLEYQESRVATLESENNELKLRIAEMQGEIKQLESVASRELVGS